MARFRGILWNTAASMKKEEETESFDRERLQGQRDTRFRILRNIRVPKKIKIKKSTPFPKQKPTVPRRSQ